jgi:YVTN family beta-propeller protein
VVSPDGSTAYVSDYSEFVSSPNSVAVVRTATDTVTTQIPFGQHPARPRRQPGRLGGLFRRQQQHHRFTVQATDSSSPPQPAIAALSITAGGCTTTITGTHPGPLRVGSGSTTCVATGAPVSGPLTVTTGGVLSLQGATVTGRCGPAAPAAWPCAARKSPARCR